MRHTPSEPTMMTPESLATYHEVTQRRHETARIVSARRYWQRTKIHLPFVPPTEDSLVKSR